ncbi:MAG: cation:proton antiporter [Acidimicrobiia bacterium]
MIFLLAFGLSLLVAVAVSERARRTVLSTSVLFLLVGLVLGPGAAGVLDLQTSTDAVSIFIELALIVVLLSDGAHLHVRQVLDSWRLPLRALGIGLPVTLALTGLAAWLLTGLPLLHALLLGAVLSPTDPVLAEAIVGREEVPFRLRRFLNVESGLNDGLALPFVLLLLAAVRDDSAHPFRIALELAVGAAVGVAVPLAGTRLLGWRHLGVAERYEALALPALGTVALATAGVLHGNLFLAAFLCGITMRTVAPELVDASDELAEALSEVVKLAALLAFGVLFSASLFSSFVLAEWVLVLVVLFAVRPVALLVAMLGRSVDWQLFAAAAWFGPKGFASVTFALLALERDHPFGDLVFHLAGLVVTASIVAHSSTDALVARKLAAELGDAD